MASDMSTSFDSRLFEDMIDTDVDDGLYCPDFTVTRRPKNHTTTRVMGYDIYEQPNLSINRPDTENGYIPVTEVDELFDSYPAFYSQPDMSLSKRNLFELVQDALDTHATSMKKTYDINTNMESRMYTVPIIGFVDNPKYRAKTYGTNIQHTHVDPDTPRERYIIIDGDTYSVQKTYKRYGGKYVPLNIPSDHNFSPKDVLASDEQTFRVSKITPSKSSITITLPKETMLTGLTVNPEQMQFEQIHSTAIRCHGNCTKKKHTISCLKNDPGFIITFKLWIRSTMTNDSWLSLGSYSANSSMYDSTRITFDSILIKELKIVPTNFHKSFDKVKITPIGLSISSAPISNEMFVTYTLMTPRDGKYLKFYDKVIDKNRGTYHCDCSLCMNRRTGKGTYKDKCRFLRDVYEM